MPTWPSSLKRRGDVSPDRYKYPPVVEALCELYFEGSRWDQTVPGRFYDLVAGDFPKRTEGAFFRTEIQVASDGATESRQVSKPRLELRNEAGSQLVQLAQDLLVVNQLQPYPESFEHWEPRIYSLLDSYNTVAMPARIKRIGVRYINNIVIPGKRVQLEQYFTIYPQLPPSLGDSHGQFMIRFEVPTREGEHHILYTFGSAPAPDADSHAFLLDLYDISSGGIAPDREAVSSRVRKARALLEGAFEDSITDKLRDIFRGGVPSHD